MRIFPPPLDIPDDEGFATGKDIFQRAAMGAGLARVMGALAAPTVLAIDGQWGSGKTTFLKMWAGLLRQNGHPVIYFDAFENDYAEDAFTALAAEIVSLINARKKQDEPRAKAFLEKAKGAGKVLARSALKIGVKAATMGAIAASDLEDLADSISSEAEDLADKYIGEMLTKQAEKRSTLQAFRDALRDLPSILAASPTPGGEPKSLIFIIDELDRCKPLFALEILERIKHFFTVPDVHFVLGVHMGQLRTSVQAAYGANIDAHTYLQKFIQVVFPLVDTTVQRHQLGSALYVQHLRSALDFSPVDADFTNAATAFVSAFARVNSISLRSIERIMSAISLAVAYTRPGHFRPAALVAGLCILKVAAPEMYVSAKRGRLTFSDVEPFFRFYEMLDNDRSIYSDWAVNFWRYCSDPDCPQDIIDRFDRGDLWRYDLENRFSILSLLANEVIDAFIVED